MQGIPISIVRFKVPVSVHRLFNNNENRSGDAPGEEIIGYLKYL